SPTLDDEHNDNFVRL
uniref:Extended FMRFamide-12 n=1 Tax=Austrophasma rawsonvillense TaxID=253137 RepID=FAR12_AUSRA|nr:RecName: Full=Extended FMRFamide-12; Short=FMRFa-12 [Austrophasma rawsonvillense]